MKTRRLTKKYKNKSKRKSIKNRKRKNKNKNKINYKSKSKSRKRILKGGEFEEKKQIFIRDFFYNLRLGKFNKALCVLHTFYTCGISDGDIRGVISSPKFKTQYDNTFFYNKTIPNIGGEFQTDVIAQERYIFFLSYIFKKLAEGETIICDEDDIQEPLSFIYIPGTKNIIKTLKQFFGYLDTACLLTLSFSIDKKTFDIISQYKKTGDKRLLTGISSGQVALYDLYTNLLLLEKNYPIMKTDIEGLLTSMEQHYDDGNVHSINFNTTNLCTLIKMSKVLFTYFD